MACVKDRHGQVTCNEKLRLIVDPQAHLCSVLPFRRCVLLRIKLNCISLPDPNTDAGPHILPRYCILLGSKKT